MEIGVYRGASVRMWLEYFENAKIYGVDTSTETFTLDPKFEYVTDPGRGGRVNDPQAPIKQPRYTFIQGDQNSPPFLKTLARDHGDWDIIIDDGGHMAAGIRTSFQWLWPHVISGGFYCIEDLYCAYRPVYQVPGQPTQMDLVKTLLDDINEGKQGIESLHFSHELAIIKRK